jgi:rod shape determining protein RodA
MPALRTWLKGWDRGLMVAEGALILISILAMVSAATTVSVKLIFRHAFWMVTGMLAHAWVARTPYRRWADAGIWLYALSIVLLLLVELTGGVRLGATRWLSIFGVSFQPSELSKLALLLYLARFLAGHEAPLPLRELLISLAVAGVPSALILAQPDLGTASILLAITAAMLWVAGISARLVAGTLITALLLSPLGWFFLHDYQRTRILVFMNPAIDPLGAGYTIIQSMIAIGSGQLTGRGWRAGTQSQLNFIPEHHSDFIFSVIGEEWGIVGCSLVLFAFGLLLWRMTRIAADAVDPQARLLATGLFGWIGYQAIVNMGMVMGLLPVVGVPLPFISYGGSSMVMLWIGLGLLQSIAREHPR